MEHRVTNEDRGRVVAQGTPAELQAATATTIHFETDGDVDLSRGEWQKLGVSATKPRTYVLHTTPRPEVVAKLAQQAAADDLDTHARSLEDAFLDITGRTLRS